MSTKTILITGVTGTVGKATALEIAKSGANTVLLARNKKKLEELRNEISEKSGNPSVSFLVADLTDVASIKAAANEFKSKNNRLDALINIAAVYRRKRELTKSNLELMFATNHLAPFVLTNELLPVLKSSAPSRIVTVAAPSTTKLNFDDLQGEKKFSSLGSFGASKMMNLLTNQALARRIEGSGVVTMTLHPGLVKSDLTKEMSGFLKFLFSMMSGKPDKPAHMLMKLALDPAYQNANGKFYKFNGKELKSSDYSYDKEVQEKLWALSEKLS